jgi:hypothetical protein
MKNYIPGELILALSLYAENDGYKRTYCAISPDHYEFFQKDVATLFGDDRHIGKTYISFCDCEVFPAAENKPRTDIVAWMYENYDSKRIEMWRGMILDELRSEMGI